MLNKYLYRTAYPSNCSNSTIETLEKDVKFVQSLTIKTPERRQ